MRTFAPEHTIAFTPLLLLTPNKHAVGGAPSRTRCLLSRRKKWITRDMYIVTRRTIHDVGSDDGLLRRANGSVPQLRRQGPRAEVARRTACGEHAKTQYAICKQCDAATLVFGRGGSAAGPKPGGDSCRRKLGSPLYRNSDNRLRQ